MSDDLAQRVRELEAVELSLMRKLHMSEQRRLVQLGTIQDLTRDVEYFKARAEAAEKKLEEKK